MRTFPHSHRGRFQPVEPVRLTGRRVGGGRISIFEFVQMDISRIDKRSNQFNTTK